MTTKCLLTKDDVAYNKLINYNNITDFRNMAKFLYTMSSYLVVIIIIIIIPAVAFYSLRFILMLHFTLVKSKLQYASCNLELYYLY